MSAPRSKYPLDTNVYIRAFRFGDTNAEYQRFLARVAPFEFVPPWPPPRR